MTCVIEDIVPNNYRVNLGHASVSANNILSFTLKEDTPNKISKNNTYVIKIQGIEMNNLSRVDKVKIEDGVYQFSVDLTPIVPALQNGPNAIEVEGTFNMILCGSSTFEGTYSVASTTDFSSIYSTNGIYVPSSQLVPSTVAGYYARRLVLDDVVIYEKITNSNKYVIYFNAGFNLWYLKKTISNGRPSNIVLYQQSCRGTQSKVPLSKWVMYGSKLVSSKCNYGFTNIRFQSCIPYDGTCSNLIFVNCGGIDNVNGLYYKDLPNNRYVNVRNTTDGTQMYMVYVVDSLTGLSYWQIQDESVVESGSDPAILYKSPSIQLSSITAGGSCIPCGGWKKISSSSPGDAPIITPLEYFDNKTTTNSIKYFDNGSSIWSLFSGTTQIATGTSDHYIVVRAPSVSGAYCLTCVSPDNLPDYTKILDTNITLSYNTNQWEIKEGSGPGVVLYSAPSDDSVVPPFDGWVKINGTDSVPPLVISSVVPSCVEWSML
jgi:hypothetical protein